MLYMTGYFSIQVEASCVVVAHRSWLTRQKSIPMHMILHIFLLTYTKNKLVEEYKCSNETWIVSCAHGNAPNLGRVDFLIFTQWHWWCSFGNVTLHFLRNWSVGFQTVVSVQKVHHHSDIYNRIYLYIGVKDVQTDVQSLSHVALPIRTSPLLCSQPKTPINTINMASDDQNLSASAASFVPGGTLDEVERAIQAELDQEDMDALVAEMNDSTMASPSAGAAAAAATSSLPAHLASQAAEFWFPECRDCTCCKGYKHGCSCGGLCQCAGGTPTTIKTSSLKTSAASQRRKSNETKQPCRFYQSGSCRFGDKCRFSHE